MWNNLRTELVAAEVCPDWILLASSVSPQIRPPHTSQQNCFVNSFLFSLFHWKVQSEGSNNLLDINSNLYFRDNSVAICGGDDRNSIKNSEKAINTSCSYGIVLGRRFFWFSCNINFSKVLSFVDLKDAKSANLEGFEVQWTIMGNQAGPALG